MAPGGREVVRADGLLENTKVLPRKNAQCYNRLGGRNSAVNENNLGPIN